MCLQLRYSLRTGTNYTENQSETDACQSLCTLRLACIGLAGMYWEGGFTIWLSFEKPQEQENLINLKTHLYCYKSICLFKEPINKNAAKRNDLKGL